MHLLYNFVVHIAAILVKIIANFNPKIKLFVKGRKDTYNTLNNNINTTDKVIWVHTASLGEYEQGLPIIEKTKEEYPTYKIVVTFFSPSGYEVKKNDKIADAIVYLPLDTLTNAKKFINAVNPKIAIFVKYEIWPNHLKVLKEKQIPTLLVSAYFKKEQSFFKWYGGFMRKSLTAFTHFFVQDSNSKKLLKSIGYNNCTVSGDTRFDRVSKILEQDNTLDFMSSFVQNKTCVVAGSTWPNGQLFLSTYINNTTVENVKFVIAPHNIIHSQIQELKNSIQKKVVLFSEINGRDISGFDVLIIDTIGILTKIYSYANIAYVGGGFTKGGLHNTLEPAVFGVPIIIGPIYKGFKEAEDLVELKGILTTANQNQFTSNLNQLLTNKEHYNTTAEINKTYVAQNIGATNKIATYIHQLLVK
ncbi:3-deoxy-D-manno-octulosonic acid transferase [Cellulophaga omnivescoria]|uniref:3-deoxy-D-manno-octulosonic acid transferase n=1 Tax=Cellulophaga omnivescoria TaxID=1888890 RepID=UPI000984E571|nr:glycosyltransferase N-terminal domain-containing protein [Cellulophaga omnivescoria]WBU90943.1 3-deoxy-D-manno-octulosonic acid transferase [Cellulophaga omnivescoria]WKB83078.1 glycosyltransferase N-terminal domain-containing protein [Cellulophaga lytica]